MQNRKMRISCIVLLVLLLFLVVCACFMGIGFYFWNSGLATTFFLNQESVVPLDDSLKQEEITPHGEEPTITQNENDSNLTTLETIDPKISHQMDEIELQVMMERGLKPSDSIDRKLYSKDQLQEKIAQDFLKDYSTEDAENEAIVLSSFGLLDPDFDLLALYTELYSEQVAGFFDTETKEMVVVQGEDFGGLERFVYAHEYTHVLQDQNFDLENGLRYNQEDCEEDTERCSAILALIEGDATLSQLQWFMNNASPTDRSELLEMITKETESPVFDSAPEFITLGITFPYEYGFMFVDHLYRNGGWGTVDRAYQNPPVSTEQILHPNRYPDDKPIPVSLPDFEGILDNGWKEIDRDVVGEWYSYLILSKGLDKNARLDEKQAESATQGWGGDSYVVYYNFETDETIMVLRSVWDSKAEAEEFADAFRSYANLRFDNASGDSWLETDSYHEFHVQADTTTWIFTPDAEIAGAIWKEINP
jgi:hypothetical protein